MNWFQRLRRYVIIKTAESYYNRMMEGCNNLYAKTRQHHYIIIDPWKGDKIIITNRADFRAMKRAINDSGMRMAAQHGTGHLSQDTMYDVHDGCFYSSLLKAELDKLMLKPEENGKAIRHLTNDIEARRRAYIRWTLDHAKIRRRKTRKERQEERIVRRELRAIRNKKPTANS